MAKKQKEMSGEVGKDDDDDDGGWGQLEEDLQDKKGTAPTSPNGMNSDASTAPGLLLIVGA